MRCFRRRPLHETIYSLTLGIVLLGSLFIEPAWGAGRYAGKSLPDILEQFRATGVALLYSTDLVLSSYTVTDEPTGNGTENILRQILRPHGLELRHAGKILLVVRAPDSQDNSEGMITGIVRDHNSRAGVVGAAVLVVELQETVTTGRVGDFWLTGIDPGSYTLQIEADGYRTARIEELEVSAGGVHVHNVDVLNRPELERLVVHASRYALREQTSGSYNRLGRTDIENLVPQGREPLRAVGRLPGAASSGLSSKANMRGGEEDEVLVIFDGLPLYEPFHLKDFQSLFSILDPRVVGALEVYTGGFPAQYGDRLSGVIDVSTVAPGDLRHTEIGGDLFNIGALSSGLFANGQGEWLASARRGTLDLFINIVNPDLGQPGYYDFLSRARYDYSEQLSFSGNVMYADDTISVREADNETRAEADYRTTHLWATLTHAPTPALSYRTLLAFVDAKNLRTGFIDRPDEADGRIDDKRSYSVLQFKQDWEYRLSRTVMTRWGLDLRRIEGDYAYSSQITFTDDDPLTTLGQFADRDIVANAAADGDQTGAYVTARWQVHTRLVGELGLRWDRQGYTIAGGDEQTSPRLSLLYQPTERTALRASWGRFYQAQGVHELQIEDGVTNFFPAQRSEHIVLGIDHLFVNQMQMRFEVYRKNMDRLRPRYENLFDPLELLPEIEADRVRIHPSSARAQGAEFMLSRDKEQSPWSWWLAASVSSVVDHIAGRDVPRNWDQPVSLKAGVNWRRSDWAVNLTGSYHTGWPTTRVTLIEDPENLDELIPLLGPRNDERLRDFTSVDLRVSRHRKLRSGSAYTLFLEVSNLLDRKNPCCVNYSLEEGPDGTDVFEKEFDHWLPIIPSIGFIWEF